VFGLSLENLSLEKLVILAIVALLVLSPERLPAAAWLARALRQIKDFASDATHRLCSEFGPEIRRAAARAARSSPGFGWLASIHQWGTPTHRRRRDLSGVPTAPDGGSAP
jgi:Sec-independent protein translocase protein TatA